MDVNRSNSICYNMGCFRMKVKEFGFNKVPDFWKEAMYSMKQENNRLRKELKKEKSKKFARLVVWLPVGAGIMFLVMMVLVVMGWI